MTIWHELREELRRLQRAEPHVLLSYPSPDGDDERPPPYLVMLESSAADVASSLHGRFGDQVELRVGALPYPPAPDTSIYAVQPDDVVPALPEGLRVRLAAPLRVASGESIRSSVVVTNTTGSQVVVNTNGQLVSRVVNAKTQERVGGLLGFMNMPLVAFPVPPAGRTEIPVIVGTSSFVAELGYTVPPGEWAFTVDLTFADGRKARSEPMPFRVD
jgi:hypothetical protein